MNFFAVHLGVIMLESLLTSTCTRVTAWSRRALSGAAIGVAVCALLAARPASAVPSFARQTGEPCAMCHTQAFGPGLTRFGRDFKLNGYTLGAANNPVPLVSGMIRGSFNHTDEGIPDGPEHGYGDNNNFAFDEASLFVAGRLLPHVGMFGQVTYDGIGHTVALDNFDLRSAFQTTVGGNDLVYGVSFNNSPTVQDLWNTTPVWGFPFADSPLAPTPSASPLIAEGVAGQVGGATAYLMYAGHLFVEAGGYATFSRDMQRSLGTFANDESEISGGAPYWRVTWQNDPNDWGGHYFALGHFGMNANVYPGRVYGSGTNEVTDLGFDANYQYTGTMEHIFEARASYIWEETSNDASRALGDTVHGTSHLNTFQLNGTYTYHQTYSLTLGYRDDWGTRDTDVFAPNPIDGSRTGKPDSEAFTFEVDYVPFGKAGSYLSPWANLRLGLQYINYFKFNGATNNYDGFGRDASDNNTLLLNAWALF
jgi:hypothetical protein